MRPLFAILLTLLLWTPAALPAAGRASLTLSAAPEVVLADGRSTTTLTASVRDGSGSPAPDGTSVRFTATLGTLERDTATVQAGTARVVLTSANTPGTSQITATAFSAAADGSSVGTLQVEFTSDRDAANTDGDARWVNMDCPEYLVYSADVKTLEAQGKHGSAHLQFRGLTISADALQVNLQSLQLLGRNATLMRGKHTVQAIELRYDLMANTGTAVVLTGPKHHPQSVNVTGYALTTSPQSPEDAQAAVNGNVYRFADISGGDVLVSARAVSVQPGDRIQFRRAAIYSQGKKVLSVPYHVMALSSDQLFGQQLVGFGSQGLFLNVPVYYHVDAHSTGTLFVRNSAAASASDGTALPSSTLGRSGLRPGMSLDLEHSYSFGSGSSGQFSVDGLTRPDWGAHWNHAQRIDDQTSSYIFVDYPSHRSLYGSSSVSRQFQGFSLNLSATGSRDPGYGGYSSSSTTVSASLQTVGRAIGHTGIDYSTGLSAQHGTATQGTPDGGTITTPVSTRSLDFRFFTAPLHTDSHTTLNRSLTIGQSWNDAGQHSLTVLGVASLSRTTVGKGNLSVNYTFRYDPLLAQLSSYSPGSTLGGGLLGASTEHRMSLSYFVAPRPRLSLGLISSYGLPLHDRSLLATADYRLSNDWGFALSSTLDKYGVAQYSDTELSVLRRVLGRDLVFTYSTQTHRVIFDVAASGL